MTSTKTIIPLEKILQEAVTEVFDTMVLLPVTPGASGDLGDGDGYIGMSMNIGGDVEASLAIGCRPHVAERILSQLVPDHGPDPDEEALRDALGEILNMMAGVCKNRFSDGGIDVQLTIPDHFDGTQVLADSVDPRELEYRLLGFDFAEPNDRIVFRLILVSRSSRNDESR